MCGYKRILLLYGSQQNRLLLGWKSRLYLFKILIELSFFSLDIAKKWVYKWSTNVDPIETRRVGHRPDSERTVEAASMPTLKIL
jgi:hypothetical protein